MSLPPLFNLISFCHGLVDFILSLFGKTHYVPVVSDPDRFGLMNTPDSKSGYMALVPEDTKWENKAPARIVLTLGGYRPIKYARQIKCPVLMVCAEKDSLVPAKTIQKCADKIKSIRLEILPAGHFELYIGEWFEKVAGMEADFLSHSLLSDQ